MDLVLAVILLGSLLGLIVLGGGGWLLHRLGYHAGFAAGSSEVIPMGGECGRCGQSFEGGTVADVITKITEHDCPAHPED